MPRFNMTYGDSKLRVTGTYSPGTPDVMYLRNGDPGYPGDPPESSIEKVELEIEVPEDLSPDANAKRKVFIDITGLMADLGHLDGEGAFHEEVEARMAEEPVDDFGPELDIDE